MMSGNNPRNGLAGYYYVLILLTYLEKKRLFKEAITVREDKNVNVEKIVFKNKNLLIAFIHRSP